MENDGRHGVRYNMKVVQKRMLEKNECFERKKP
jgi:hypothetical protein